VRDKNIKKEVDMNSIGDIMKGGISAILIAVGYIVLLCGIVCLIWSATGGMMAEMGNGQGILWCGVSCVVFAAILIGSGVAWYYIVKPKA
jgi:hypothetical protein